MLTLLLIPIGLYFAILLALFLFQDRLLFPASQVGGSGPIPAAAQPLRLGTPDGETLHGLHIPPRAAAANGPVILGFGGNAWNGAAVAAYLHDQFPNADIVAFHYRGYAPSTGTPGAKALTADALLIDEEAARLFPGRRRVAIGFSVGTGVAAHLAAHRPLAGAILVTPFDDLARVAADHYPWLPVRLLFRHPMNSAARLKNSAVPVAIVAAGRDTLILPRRTEALRPAVANLVFDRTIGDAGHNDIYAHPAFGSAMDEALAAVLAAGAVRPSIVRESG
jgi:dienelactone hydrolase